MRTALHLLAASLVSFVPLALASAADEAGKPKDAPSKQAEMAAANFKALDKDQDGVLTLDEFKGNRKRSEALEQAEEIFKLIDADGDKRISLKEFVERPAEARFKQMDKDADGKLTFEEFKGRREKPEEIEQAEQTFKRMDANGDKAVSLEEFKAAQKKPAKPAGKKFQPKPVEKQ